MAPRRSAASGEDDQCPMLKLIMEKGPLAGQTNEFRPGSRINIGRIIRGNSLSIKDAGISSKHLVIQVEPGSESGRSSWAITDLGSSNGTVLNGVQLEPSEPVVLSEGDVIKIGEMTSIKVKFEVSGGEREVDSKNVRRNARRRVRGQVGELGVIDEDSELGLGDKHLGSENNLGTGFRNDKYEDLGNKGGKLGVADEEKMRGRRTRGSTAGKLENGVEENLGRVSLRRTRSSKKNESLATSTIDLDEDEENLETSKMDNVAEAELKQGKKVRGRPRSSRKIENTLENLDMNGDKDLGPTGVKGGQGVSVRRTRSSRKEEDIGESGTDLGIVEAKCTRKGTRGRKKLLVETPLEEKQEDESNLETRDSEVGVSELIEGVDSGKEGAAGLANTPGVREGAAGLASMSKCNEGVAGFASTSGVKEGAVDTGNGGAVLDLAKMTLGEWFDFLEVFLPKQIIDATEEMISEMRQKAERLHEFMLQQKNANERGEVAMD
ncbi:hypothetical protein CDL12_11777 [Handroanthus impetiginosus]|uniref:FHA domain-containing protein n=1 Tax=Handroanthus impetiginosus TaxID=429701 RepID=A0A2G9HDH9_9LAMI|nr:hypothetical protein CDL12_11777 [Handroanthus impetiginosus]